MALIGRIFVIVFAFMIASLAAALVLQLVIVLPFWRALTSSDINDDTLSVVLGFGFIVVSALAILPTVAVIAIAEAFKMRSFLFYGVAGAVDALFIAHGVGGGLQLNDSQFAPFIQAFAAAGIVAGLVYWLIAGRNAGRWCERPLARP